MKNLDGKTAAVFAATGDIASGVARAFAEAGATVWISGRDTHRLESVADRIRKAGGQVNSAAVDALDEAAVAAWLDEVERENGLDVVFNGIGGTPSELRYPRLSMEATLEDFMVPVSRVLGSQFVTSREAGRRMAPKGRGSIVTLSATLSGMTAANMAGISAACGGVEAMTRALAGDFGPAGVRVNCVRGSAMPETRTIQHTFAGQTAIRGEPMPMTAPPLGRPITVAETAGAAVFLASDAASGMTGQVVTVCAGQFVG